MGHWQNWVRRELESGAMLLNPISSLKGKAASYAPHYERSLKSLFRQLEDEGWSIGFQRGPRGGSYGGSYYLYIERRKVTKCGYC